MLRWLRFGREWFRARRRCSEKMQKSPGCAPMRQCRSYQSSRGSGRLRRRGWYRWAHGRRGVRRTRCACEEDFGISLLSLRVHRMPRSPPLRLLLSSAAWCLCPRPPLSADAPPSSATSSRVHLEEMWLTRRSRSRSNHVRAQDGTCLFAPSSRCQVQKQPETEGFEVGWRADVRRRAGETS